MNTWEYLVLKNPTPGQMTALGREGWELVAVTCIVTWLWRSEKAFFKRPAPVPPVLPVK